MDFLMSPVVADISMEFVEEAVISTSPSPVRFWKRYISINYQFSTSTYVRLALFGHSHQFLTKQVYGDLYEHDQK